MVLCERVRIMIDCQFMDSASSFSYSSSLQWINHGGKYLRCFHPTHGSDNGKIQLINKDLKPPILSSVLVAYVWGFKSNNVNRKYLYGLARHVTPVAQWLTASESQRHELDSRRGFRFLCARDSKNTSSFIFEYNLENIQCHWKEKTNYFSTSSKIKLFCSCVLICRRW